MGFLDLFRIGKIKSENETLKQKLQLLHADEYFQIREQLDAMTAEISSNNSVLSQQRNEISELSNQRQKLDKQVNTQKNKLAGLFWKWRHKQLGLKLGFSIPCNCFGGAENKSLWSDCSASVGKDWRMV